MISFLTKKSMLSNYYKWTKSPIQTKITKSSKMLKFSITNQMKEVEVDSSHIQNHYNKL